MSTLPYFQDNRNSEAQVLKIGLSHAVPGDSYGICHMLRQYPLSSVMFQSCIDFIYDHENSFVNSNPIFNISLDPFSESYDSIDLEF